MIGKELHLLNKDPDEETQVEDLEEAQGEAILAEKKKQMEKNLEEEKKKKRK